VARILLVDDEAAVQNTLRAYLEVEGHEVRTAENYDSAISWLNSDCLDLIVTDVILGKRTGLDILKAAKKTQPDTPVIVITGQPSLNTASRCVKDGAFDLLEKPLSQSDFIDATRKAIKNIRRVKKRESLNEKNKVARHHLGKELNKRSSENALLIKELIKTEKKYRMLVETLPEIIFELDKDFRVIWYNEIALRFFGYTLYNRSFLSFSSSGSERDETIAKLCLVDHASNHPLLFKFRAQNKLGEERILSWAIKSLNKPSGETYGFIATARDITERERVEREARGS
jgi:PAS domain S-box-containing protein